MAIQDKMLKVDAELMRRLLLDERPSLVEKFCSRSIRLKGFDYPRREEEADFNLPIEKASKEKHGCFPYGDKNRRELLNELWEHLSQ